MRYLFNAQRRLDKPGFEQVFGASGAKPVRVRGITLLSCENADSGPRLGVVVGKRKLRRANQRNQFKRILRESFRLKQFDLPKVDLVVIARPDVAVLSRADIQREVEKLWEKLIARYAQSSSPVSDATRD